MWRAPCRSCQPLRRNPNAIRVGTYATSGALASIRALLGSGTTAAAAAVLAARAMRTILVIAVNGRHPACHGQRLQRAADVSGGVCAAHVLRQARATRSLGKLTRRRTQMFRFTGKVAARNVLVAVGVSAAVASVACAMVVSGRAAAAASASTLPSYVVTQEGLTQDDGQRLADAFGIPNALAANGAFAFVDRARFEQVPLTKVGEGTDEVGRRTLSQALNLNALARIRPLSDDDALARAA